MKLSKNEKYALSILLGQNCCECGCMLKQKKTVRCEDMDENGEYKCTFLKAIQGLEKKFVELGWFEENEL